MKHLVEHEPLISEEWLYSTHLGIDNWLDNEVDEDDDEDDADDSPNYVMN